MGREELISSKKKEIVGIPSDETIVGIKVTLGVTNAQPVGHEQRKTLGNKLQEQLDLFVEWKILLPDLWIFSLDRMNDNLAQLFPRKVRFFFNGPSCKQLDVANTQKGSGSAAGDCTGFFLQ